MSAPRVLLVHNAYQLKGGEDSVVANERALLEQQGHSVALYLRDNAELEQTGKAQAAGEALWSARSNRELASLIGSFRPDVIHAHNTFPLVSPSVYWVAQRSGVPVVQTLHNFRLLCPQAIFLREGKICEDCLGKSPWRGVVRKCYRDSLAQSAVLAGMLQLHRAIGTYRHKVTRYIALNAFCRDKLVQGGLPADRIRIKPNFVADIAPMAVDAQRDGFLFVGRLSSEKGVAVLARAWREFKPGRLLVVGDGPEAAALQGLPDVALAGRMAGDEVRRQMGRASALVLPSICYESMPMTVLEAYASGLPVIASRLGALPDLVEEGKTGLLFAPGDAADLAVKLRWAGEHPEAMLEMGRNARLKYEAGFTPASNYQQLMTIYEEAIQACK